MKMLLFPIFSDYEAFEEAAEQFQPYIKFFATFDKSVSQRQADRGTDRHVDHKGVVMVFCCCRWPKS